MELRIKGKTALITGGSRGIGFGVARLLAEEGCNLHLVSRKAENLEAARKMILASDRASYVTGTVLTVDGGRFYRG